jgi:hypothetical protein
MSSIKLVFRETRLDTFLNAPRGEVGQWLKLRGMRVLAAAKAQVGVDTGALRASLHMRHLRDPRGQYLKIGSPLKYARAHHDGTRPHIITPNKKQVLKFTTRGQVVFARAVRHPGTKANRYLTDNLKLIK